MEKKRNGYSNIKIIACVQTLNWCEVKVSRIHPSTVGVPSRRGGGYSSPGPRRTAGECCVNRSTYAENSPKRVPAIVSQCQPARRDIEIVASSPSLTRLAAETQGHGARGSGRGRSDFSIQRFETRWFRQKLISFHWLRLAIAQSCHPNNFFPVQVC